MHILQYSLSMYVYVYVCVYVCVKMDKTTYSGKEFIIFNGIKWPKETTIPI